MAFPEMQPWQYPPRLWSIEGYPGSGKSTFAAQMKTPILAIDADHRFREILPLVEGRVYELSKDPIDHIDTNRMVDALAANMPGARVGTIVVDSLSAILEPLIVKAMMDKGNGKVRNQMAAWSPKALAMRQLQDAVTRWGTDVLWIYHLRDIRDANAREQTTTSVTRTELERLKRSINLRLRIVEQDGQRAVKVVWARRGRAGMTIPDTAGNWAGMPARIEAAVYDDLDAARKQAIPPSQGEKSQVEKPQGEKQPAQGQGRPGQKEEPPEARPALDGSGKGAALRYADGSAVSSNPRAIADYRAYEAAEGKPPASLAELRAWIRRQA